MPTVPLSQRQTQTQTGPVNTQNLQIPKNGGFSALADIGANALDVYQQHRQKQDLAASQEALLQFNQYADDLFNNTETGLITKQGKNAIGVGVAYAGQLSSKAQELMDTVPEGPAREQLRMQLQQTGQSYGNRFRQYEVGQQQQYEASQFQGIIKNYQDQAINLYGDNDQYVMVNAQARQQIIDYGQAHGQSDEEIEANWTRFKESTASAALENASSTQFMQMLAQNGEPADTTGSMRVTPGGNSSSARGLRNNNPGNIEASDKNPWEGQQGSDGRFAKFITPEHGIRALGKNLLAYQRQGFDTVTEVVNRWAPASDGNNTDAYIKALCSALGVGADDKLDMSNPQTLAALCAGIVKHENGKQPYSSDQLNTGVSAALGLTSLESPKRYTGSAAFDAADPQSQAKYLRQADAMRRQQQAEMRSQLDGVVRDASAAYQRGLEFANPPGEAEFVAAYGYREGKQHFTELENQRIAGQYIGSFNTMPTQNIVDYVAALKPSPDDGEGYAQRAATYDSVVTAAHRVINNRQTNPYQAASDLGLYKPLNTNSATDIANEVSSRFASKERLQQLGINAPILSRDEAAGLTEMVRGSTDADQTMNLLQSLGQQLPPAAMRQVAASIAPNSAATAYTALLLGTPDNQYNNRSGVIAYDQFVGYKPTMNKYDVAKSILTGDQLINPTDAMKKAGITAVQLPSDEKLKKAFDDGVGNSFSNNPQARQAAYGIYKAAYASLVYRNADSDKASTLVVDDESAEKAVQMATGGVYKGFQGGDVVMPFGMDKSTFKDKYTIAARDAFADAGLPPAGQSNFTPVNIGNGQYKLLAGSGRWAVNPKTGQPIVVGVE
ncbi:hypothetical protein [Serratia nevei]|uniref:hypothetical protein n=1 Tax=Serratia nevei TaxID=2703794 RepID=UPI00313F1C88